MSIYNWRRYDRSDTIKSYTKIVHKNRADTNGRVIIEKKNTIDPDTNEADTSSSDTIEVNKNGPSTFGPHINEADTLGPDTIGANTYEQI